MVKIIGGRRIAWLIPELWEFETPVQIWPIPFLKMARTKKVKAAGRFGARYGKRVRNKIVQIESDQRKKQKCMFCDGTAKRLSKGIWKCKKCDKKFTGRTFFLKKEE